MGAKKGENNKIFYECKICDYNTSKKSHYDRHNDSKKHLKQMKQNETNCFKKGQKEKNCYHECEFCDEIFNSRTTLWRHKKNNHSNESIEDDKNEEIEINEENKTITSNKKSNNTKSFIKMGLFMNNKKSITSNNVISLHNIIIKQQEELKEKQEELKEKQEELKEKYYELNKTKNELEVEKLVCKRVCDMASKQQTINNTTNNTTNNMTINVFLNEKCKDAINLIDFVKNLNISWDYVQNTGKTTLENTISKLLIDNMKDMDITKRPLHCTDKKRLQYYVKDGEWKKESADEVIDKVIYNISDKHRENIINYCDENPEWMKADENTSIYFSITENSFVFKKEMPERIKKVKKLLSDSCYLKMPFTFN